MQKLYESFGKVEQKLLKSCAKSFFKAPDMYGKLLEILFRMCMESYAKAIGKLEKSYTGTNIGNCTHADCRKRNCAVDDSIGAS